MSHQRKHPLNCVLTNGATGLGRAIAQQLAMEGGRLILLGLPDDKDQLYHVAKHCAKIGAPGCDMQFPDLSDEAMFKTAVSILSRHGGVDVFVVVPPAQAQGSAEGEDANKGQSGLTITKHLEAYKRIFKEFVGCMKENKLGYVIGVGPAEMQTLEAEQSKGLVAKMLGEETWGSGLKRWLESVREETAGCNIKVAYIAAPPDPSVADCAAVAKAALTPFMSAKDSSLTTEIASLTISGVKGVPEVEAVPHKPTKPTPAKHEAFGGIIEKTGARVESGLLVRVADKSELGKAKQDRPGVVMVPADPKNLEPDENHVYTDQPKRDPAMLVQCFAPYNAETPHSVLATNFITPANLHFVRNHLPVPKHMDLDKYRLRIEFNGTTTELTLDDIKTKFPPVTITSVIQCAGNRRNDMAAEELVVGRAPWNAGGIGNAQWTGARMRDVFAALFGSQLDLDDPHNNKVHHVIFQGADQHAKTNKWYEVSIPFEKAVDRQGDVLLAYHMNGAPPPMDHGFPLRVVVPGYVGARQCKWLERITLSEEESQSAWQQNDYKIMPQSVKTIEEADWSMMPPVENLNVQSAILLPEAGTVFEHGTKSITVKGYAWSGGGQPISRVDVSANGGKTWQVAKITNKEVQPTGRAWAWVLWEADVAVPEELQAAGGKFSICCKAMDRMHNTQPDSVHSIWNFRGLCCNSWHIIDYCILPKANNWTMSEP